MANSVLRLYSTQYTVHSINSTVVPNKWSSLLFFFFVVFFPSLKGREGGKALYIYWNTGGQEGRQDYAYSQTKMKACTVVGGGGMSACDTMVILSFEREGAGEAGQRQ